MMTFGRGSFGCVVHPSRISEGWRVTLGIARVQRRDQPFGTSPRENHLHPNTEAFFDTVGTAFAEKTGARVAAPHLRGRAGTAVAAPTRRQPVGFLCVPVPSGGAEARLEAQDAPKSPIDLVHEAIGDLTTVFAQIRLIEGRDSGQVHHGIAGQSDGSRG